MAGDAATDAAVRDCGDAAAAAEGGGADGGEDDDDGGCGEGSRGRQTL